MRWPIILLSPAKSLNFDAALSSALAALTPTEPLLLEDVGVLTKDLAKLSKAQLKSLMGLSDGLAALNHERFGNFDAQPARPVIGAFEGQAYKGLDAASLGAKELAYLQDSLRILCGLYGVLRPLDQIRPYRLEMGLKFACAGKKSLYDYWGDRLTQMLAAEAKDSCPFVLNVASQEYAKSVDLGALGVPVVTACFPGPAVHAKTARGEMARFCATRQLTDPAQLREFTGSSGNWAFVPSESDESQLTFKRSAGGAAAAKAGAPMKAAQKKRAAEEEQESAPPAKSSGRKKR